MNTLDFKISYVTIEEIPLSEYKNLHKKYWEFIANNHLNYKPSIVNRYGESLDLNFTCFACQYADYSFNDFKKCICPIKSFRNKDGHCSNCKKTLYAKWTRFLRLGRCQENLDEIAHQIANLEWEDYRDGN